MLREVPLPAVPDRDQCKAELAAVIASGIFAKAPSLALLLEYVCAKYFDGEANQVKEYNIAVEALGRPPSFEPRQDSIVRVEAFRLRKRLKQYYENEGADRHLRIVIPSGQYVPQFVENGRSANNGEAPEASPDSGDDETVALALALEAGPPEAPLSIVPAQPIAVPSTIARPRRPTWIRLAAYVGVLLIVVASAIAIRYSRAHSPAKADVMPKAASAGTESRGNPNPVRLVRPAVRGPDWQRLVQRPVLPGWVRLRYAWPCDLRDARSGVVPLQTRRRFQLRHPFKARRL